MNIIKEFSGKNEFLSNFAPCRIEYLGRTFTSTEAAFQAAKSLDPEFHTKLSKMTPGQSKRTGRAVELRSDWEEVKDQVMLEILRKKFSKGSELAKKLDSTGDSILVEGTVWHDQYWGICLCEKHNGIGRNVLGQLLMKVRDENRGIDKELSLNHEVRTDWLSGGPYV